MTEREKLADHRQLATECENIVFNARQRWPEIATNKHAVDLMLTTLDRCAAALREQAPVPAADGLTLGVRAAFYDGWMAYGTDTKNPHPFAGDQAVSEWLMWDQGEQAAQMLRDRFEPVNSAPIPVVEQEPDGWIVEVLEEDGWGPDLRTLSLTPEGARAEYEGYWEDWDDRLARLRGVTFGPPITHPDMKESAE